MDSCNICKKVYSSKHSLNRHERSSHKNVRYECEECKKTFAQKDLLLRHVRALHLGLKCPYCCKVCSTRQQLIAHENECSKSRPAVECELCKKPFSSVSNLNKHKRVTHENKRFCCELCQASYTDISNLLSHQQKKHGSGEFGQASIHNGATKKQDEIEVEKKNSCGTKDEIRKRKSSFQCEICGSVLGYLSNLQRHIMINHKGCRFKCMHCPKEFRLKENLAKHIRVVHEHKRYCCKRCPKIYRLKSSLLKHIESYHINYEPFRCGICKVALKSFHDLQAHRVEFHNIRSGKGRKYRKCLKSLKTKPAALGAIIPQFPKHYFDFFTNKVTSVLGGRNILDEGSMKSPSCEKITERVPPREDLVKQITRLEEKCSAGDAREGVQNVVSDTSIFVSSTAENIHRQKVVLVPNNQIIDRLHPKRPFSFSPSLRSNAFNFPSKGSVESQNRFLPTILNVANKKTPSSIAISCNGTQNAIPKKSYVNPEISVAAKLQKRNTAQTRVCIVDKGTVNLNSLKQMFTNQVDTDLSFQEFVPEMSQGNNNFTDSVSAVCVSELRSNKENSTNDAHKSVPVQLSQVHSNGMPLGNETLGTRNDILTPEDPGLSMAPKDRLLSEPNNLWDIPENLYFKSPDGQIESTLSTPNVLNITGEMEEFLKPECVSKEPCSLDVVDFTTGFEETEEPLDFEILKTSKTPLSLRKAQKISFSAESPINNLSKVQPNQLTAENLLSPGAQSIVKGNLELSPMFPNIPEQFSGIDFSPVYDMLKNT